MKKPRGIIKARYNASCSLSGAYWYSSDQNLKACQNNARHIVLLMPKRGRCSRCFKWLWISGEKQSIFIWWLPSEASAAPINIIKSTRCLVMVSISEKPESKILRSSIWVSESPNNSNRLRLARNFSIWISLFFVLWRKFFDTINYPIRDSKHNDLSQNPGSLCLQRRFKAQMLKKVYVLEKSPNDKTVFCILCNKNSAC